MQRARCGNPDLGTYNSIGRPVNVDIPESLSNNIQGRSGKDKKVEHYVTKTHWPKKHLKWFIEEYPEKQKYIPTRDHIRRIINQSFYDWEKYSGLKFEMVKTKEEANLKIRFHSEDHGDGYPFDGQGATLAHAFYPTSGDIHFDDDEYFTDDYKNKNEHYTLRLVAAHEIGHALGLSHSFEEGSLMYPVYQQFNSTYELTNDDQHEIQTLYGKPEIRTTIEQLKTTLSPKVTSKYSSDILPIDNWCSGEFQTGCEGPDGELYLFKDNQVWRYQAKKKYSWDPQPTLISERFPSLIDTTITACVKSSMGYTYLFRNYFIWKMKTHWAIDGPHILHGKHYPQNPRVALLHQNSIYLIRNRLIYRLNEFDYNQELEIRTIDSILNPPPNEFIQSGFTYNQRHYIFTRRYVYVYDSTHGSLLPGYPKSIYNGWFACESASQVQKTKKKITSTMRPLTTGSSRKHDHHEDEDDHHFYRHHHHHHHHRPRRPFYHHNHHHHHRPPPPPHEYRRRWED
jgi:predicted Zn-dependent protease